MLKSTIDKKEVFLNTQIKVKCKSENKGLNTYQKIAAVYEQVIVID